MQVIDTYRNFTGNAQELCSAAIDFANQMDWPVNPEKTTERLVRYYVAEGVLEKPDRQGRDATYAFRHLLQLLNARRMVEKGMSLSVIGEHNRHAETPALEEYLKKPIPTEAELLVSAFKSHSFYKAPAQKSSSVRPPPMAIPDVLAEVKRMKEDWMQEISFMRRLRDDFDHLRKELMVNREMVEKTQNYFHNTLENLAHVSMEREVEFMKKIGNMLESQVYEAKRDSEKLREEFRMLRDILQRDLDQIHERQEKMMDLAVSIDKKLSEMK